METNFIQDFNEYLEQNPDFYEYYTDSSYFELADWYNAKYSKDMFVDRNISEAYEFARWVTEGVPHLRHSSVHYRDYTVFLRERYPDLDFGDAEIGEDTEHLLETYGISIPKVYKYEEESCYNTLPQVSYERIDVGDTMWYNSLSNSVPKWEEVVVTHRYGGILFFKRTKPESEEDAEEMWLPKGSFGFVRELYPKKVVVPKGMKFECDCPFTVFENEP
jgi:hypothetical protein